MTHQATRQAAIDYLADAIGVLAGDPANEPTMRVLAGILAALIERGEQSGAQAPDGVLCRTTDRSAGARRRLP
jgi:hypothetical protein